MGLIRLLTLSSRSVRLFSIHRAAESLPRGLFLHNTIPEGVGTQFAPKLQSYQFVITFWDFDSDNDSEKDIFWVPWKKRLSCLIGNEDGNNIGFTVFIMKIIIHSSYVEN